MNMRNASSRTHTFILFGLLLLFGNPVVASAQVDTASLTGLVTDANGAAVEGARVAATNRATDISTETTTGGDGYFTFASLRPGVYTVAVEQAGFKRETRTELQLSVGQRARLDFALTVGDVSEAVTVASDAIQLQREDASLGNVVDNRRITGLPLLQRSWDDLLPQVAGTQGDPYTEQSGGTASGRTGGVNIHGVRSLMNNFILDGQDNNSISTNVQELSTQVSRPSVDAIGEFKVVTSQYSAGTGRAAGGVISVTTKSGTNDFHGVLYEYHRNKVFDANDFFSNRLGREKPQRIQNQFGGNIGGPIRRDRAFFFADYEGTRIRQGVLRIATVPLAVEQAGNFSANLGNEILFSGQRVPVLNPDGTPSGQFVRQGQIFDPRTQVANPLFNASQPASPLNPRFIRQPFAGNVITDIDPVARRLAALYPSPTLAGRANNFARTPNLSDDQDRFTTRVDYRVAPGDDIFGRYAYIKRDRFVPGFFGGLADGTDTSAWGQNDIKSHSLTVGWNSVLASSVVNQFRFGYSRAEADAVQEPFGEGSSSDFIAGVPEEEIVQGGLPAVLISGFSPRLGSPDFLPKFQHSQQYQFTNTTTWTRGVHTLRFGADVMAPLKLDYLDVPNTRGRVTFDNTYTQFAGGLAGTGAPLADFLVGTARNAALSNLLVVNQRRHMYAFFAQDDWKVSPRLTLNLGLRYDFGSPAYEENNRIANFDPAAGLAATGPAQAFASLRLASDGSLEDRALVRPDRNNFAPRVGFAYSLNDETVARGGYGIYYNLIDRIGSEDQLSLNPPFLVNFNFTPSDTFTPALNLSTGFAAGTLDPSTVDVSRVQLRAANPDASTPYIQQWSLSLQREFWRDWLAEVAYVGTKGTHLMTLRDLNQPLPGQTNLPRAVRFPFPAFGLIEYRDDNGISNYHSMEATLDKRFNRGWTLRAVYTLSKSLDNSFEHLTGGGSNSFPQNARDYGDWYGPSDFDVRHRFVVNGIWELPFGRGRAYVNDGLGAALLGGWELTGSFNARSGRPFTVTQSGDPLSLGSLSTTLPDLVGDPRAEDQTVDRWFNPAAFRPLASASNRFGNQGRNALRGPDFASLDFSLHRRFGLGGESRYLDFRWEVFNALNRANFGLPNRNIAASNAGTITTLAGDPRVMQFALRLNF